MITGEDNVNISKFIFFILFLHVYCKKNNGNINIKMGIRNIEIKYNFATHEYIMKHKINRNRKAKNTIIFPLIFEKRFIVINLSNSYWIVI